MNQPTITSVNYDRFREELRRAAATGAEITTSDRERWSAWVKAHQVREAAFKSVAGRQFGSTRPVIIDEPGEWGGYFIYTEIEQACLKWVPAEG